MEVSQKLCTSFPPIGTLPSHNVIDRRKTQRSLRRRQQAQQERTIDCMLDQSCSQRSDLFRGILRFSKTKTRDEFLNFFGHQSGRLNDQQDRHNAILDFARIGCTELAHCAASPASPRSNGLTDTCSDGRCAHHRFFACLPPLSGPHCGSSRQFRVLLPSPTSDIL